MLTFENHEPAYSRSAARSEEDWPWEEGAAAEGVALGPSLEPSLEHIERAVDGISYEPVGAVHGLGPASMGAATLQDLAAVCALCNEASIEFVDGRYTRLGEPTEAALKVLVEKLGVPSGVKSMDPLLMARQSSDHWAGAYQRLALLEFSRDRKCMSALCRSRELGVNRLMVKGAAEVQ